MITTPKTFAEAVRRVSELAHAKMPEALHGPIERATAIVLHGGVWLEEDGRHAQVLASSGETWYRCNGHCTCLDAPKAPEGLCTHRLALMIYRRAGDLLRSAAFPLPEGEASAPAPTCPEAQFSATFTGTVGGVATMMTARGATFGQFTANVQAVRALFDAPLPAGEGTGTPAGSAPGPQGAPWVCKYHSKGRDSKHVPGGRYCPAKLADGSHCTEQWPPK